MSKNIDRLKGNKKNKPLRNSNRLEKNQRDVLFLKQPHKNL